MYGSKGFLCSAVKRVVRPVAFIGAGSGGKARAVERLFFLVGAPASSDLVRESRARR